MLLLLKLHGQWLYNLEENMAFRKDNYNLILSEIFTDL